MASSSTSNSSTDRLVRFYDPAIQAPNAQGRTLHSILSWGDYQLEDHHDYIQWLFPLPERSPVAPSAPVITREIFNAFRTRSDLRNGMRQALNRICQFYGFLATWTDGRDDSFTMAKYDEGEFQDQAVNWVMRFNHNHLRITRIIRSLRVLGLEHEAATFFSAVAEVHRTTGKIGDRSLMFWRRAAERPLYLAPEKEADDGTGADFLYEHEGAA